MVDDVADALDSFIGVTGFMGKAVYFTTGDFSAFIEEVGEPHDAFVDVSAGGGLCDDGGEWVEGYGLEDFVVTDVGDVAGFFEAVGVFLGGVLGVDGGDLIR